jgi:hypothetical protein
MSNVTQPDPDVARVAAVHARYAERLMQMPHVVGVGVGYATEHGQPTDELSLIVMVDHKLKRDELAAHELLPHTLEGVRVDVQEYGGFVSL